MPSAFVGMGEWIFRGRICDVETTVQLQDLAARFVDLGTYGRSASYRPSWYLWPRYSLSKSNSRSAGGRSNVFAARYRGTTVSQYVGVKSNLDLGEGCEIHDQRLGQSRYTLAAATIALANTKYE